MNWLMNFVKRMMKYETQKQLLNYEKNKKQKTNILSFFEKTHFATFAEII